MGIAKAWGEAQKADWRLQIWEGRELEVGGTRLRQSFGAAWGIGHRAEGIEERRKAIWVIRLRRH